jgi:hypothetical protein
MILKPSTAPFQMEADVVLGVDRAPSTLLSYGFPRAPILLAAPSSSTITRSFSVTYVHSRESYYSKTESCKEDVLIVSIQPTNVPTILAASSFVGLGVITSDVYMGETEEWCGRSVDPDLLGLDFIV